MQDDSQELVLQIIQKAKENKHFRPLIITGWREYRFYLKLIAANNAVIKILRKSANFTFKSYCREVAKGQASFTSLIAYQQFFEIIDYYEQEVVILSNMVTDYEDWLGPYNIIPALLGFEREL